MEFLSGAFATIPLWLVWPIIVGIVVYWFLTKKHNYWKEVGIPYVRPVPVLGSVGEMFRVPFHEMELQRYREKGRIYGSYEGSRPVITVGDPDVLRDILVKDFQFFTGRRVFSTGNPLSDKMVQNLQGEDWKRVRAVITPAFTTGKLKRTTSVFMDSARTLTSNFRTAENEGKPIDAKKLFGAFTMDIIASAAFGTKIDSHNDPENPFVTAAKTVFTRKISWRVMLLLLFPGLLKIFRIDLVPPSGLNFFKDVTLKILEERKRTGQKRNDFLQVLIDSTNEGSEKEMETATDEKDETKEMGHEEGNDQIFKPYYSSKSLSTDELIAQCVIFFLAGYDTTASTLTFTAYELALNPHVQDRLIAEIDETIKKKGELSYEAICGMKYLDNVISETLRKYPPSSRTVRLAEEDYDIKGHDITVPKGMIVRIPIHAIHHDPEHYPDPEKYDPDRFTPEQKSTRHRYTYLPFGAGPRNCIGMRFALLEIKVCLAYVLSQFRFSTCSKTQVPLKFHVGQGLMQPKEVLLQVEVRKDAKKL